MMERLGKNKYTFIFLANMKDFLARIRDNIAHESLQTKITLGALAFVFLFGVVSTIGGITGSLIQANVAQTAVAQPQERPDAPGYAVEIIAEKTSKPQQAISESEAKTGIFEGLKIKFLELF